MRNVEHGERHCRAQRIEDRVEGLGGEVVDPLQCCWRGKQRQVIGAFRQQALDEIGVDALWREHRIGDALRGILVEVEACGPETEVKVGNHRIELQVASDRPGDIVSDGGRPDAALGPDHGNDPPHRLGIRRRIQSADRPHDIQRADRRDQVVADAAPGQLAVKQHIVLATDDQHAAAGVADFGQRIETGQNGFAAALGLQNDDIRRRRAAIGLDGGSDAAHLDLQMCLPKPTILTGGLDRGRSLDGFAKCLHRYARCRRDVLVGGGRDVGGCACAHCPTSLILPLAESGYTVAVPSPRRYFSRTVVRRAV